MSLYDDEEPDRGPVTEDEYAVYDAGQAFDVLVERYGFQRAAEIMATIIRNAMEAQK